MTENMTTITTATASTPAPAPLLVPLRSAQQAMQHRRRPRHPLVAIRHGERTFTLACHNRQDLFYRRWHQRRIFYELDLLQSIARLDRHGVYLDIGAHVGNHSIFFANFCPCESLIAVEPRLETFRILDYNLRRNLRSDTTDWIALQFAVGRENGQYVELAPINPHNSGDSEVAGIVPSGNTITPPSNAAEPQPDRAATRTLDHITDCWSYNKIAVIKIDVQGMEAAVLDGGTTTISCDKPAIAIEATTAEEYAAIESRLKPIGYRVIFKTQKRPRSFLWVAD